MAHEFKVKNGLIVDGKFYLKSGDTNNTLGKVLVYNDGTTEVSFRDVETIQGVSITGGTYFSGSSTLELYNSTGGTISITGVTSGGGGSGTSGTSGESGSSGTSGTSGNSGSSGTSGTSGSSGSSGTSGTTGTSGTSGTTGTSGTSGSSGSSGSSPVSATRNPHRGWCHQ